MTTNQAYIDMLSHMKKHESDKTESVSTWRCDYCGTYNVQTLQKCNGCNAPRARKTHTAAVEAVRNQVGVTLSRFEYPGMDAAEFEARVAQGVARALSR